MCACVYVCVCLGVCLCVPDFLCVCVSLFVTGLSVYVSVCCCVPGLCALRSLDLDVSRKGESVTQ